MPVLYRIIMSEKKDSKSFDILTQGMKYHDIRCLGIYDSHVWYKLQYLRDVQMHHSYLFFELPNIAS